MDEIHAEESDKPCHLIKYSLLREYVTYYVMNGNHFHIYTQERIQRGGVTWVMTPPLGSGAPQAYQGTTGLSGAPQA